MQQTLLVTVLGAQCVSFKGDDGKDQTFAKVFICNPALPDEADRFKGLAVQTMDITADLYKSLILPAAPVQAELTVRLKTATKGKAGFEVQALRVIDPAVNKKAS